MYKKLEIMKHNSFKQAHTDAYNRVVSSLEHSLETERIINALQGKRQKLLEKAECEQQSLKNFIYKHHFSVLQKQIEEKKRRKLIEEKEALTEKELTDELYKPKRFNIKEQLDAQLEEKKRIKKEIQDKEAEIDKLYLDSARKSLESEMKRKSDSKKVLQSELRESWKNTQKTNNLRKAIDRMRRFGDNYIIESEEDEDFEEREKFGIGKINEKLFNKQAKDANSIEKIKLSNILEIVPQTKNERSKSMLSRISKHSQKKVLEKINKLTEQEDKIKKERIDVISFLQSKSNSKSSSRSATVAGLMKSRGLQANVSL
ncbi:hypothetical protein SteCoe_35906 [Stentor coeruleus]|uniref:Trichohyalin-plectin-homology domain-containing protein n=1 Tax=Stentor coeruleus TaxID=5963 RepID=A0A1R2ARK0_9CILI|nr:hypothetical protein SteCoe_35906 [Stentor coeruleus]